MGRFPCARSPYRRSLGILPSSMHYVTKPMHTSLLLECVLTVDTSSLQDTAICDLILPRNAQNLSKTAHVKGVEPSFLSGMKNPGLSAIHQSAYDAGFVDLDLGMLCQLFIGPHPLRQPGHGGSCLADALVKLRRSWILDTRSHGQHLAYAVRC